MKTGTIICLVALMFLSGCSFLRNKGEESGNSQDEFGRTFVELEYLGEMEDVMYRVRYTPLDIEPGKEFSYWNHYTVEEYLSSSEYYPFSLPDDIDGEKKDIIISFGRKLKCLYYYENEKFNFVDGFDEKGYRGRIVFEKDYIHRGAYIYSIDKVSFVDSELVLLPNGTGGGEGQFMSFYDGNIPLELPNPEDEIVDLN